MELLLEQQTTKLTNDEIAAREHNAQIKERYLKLQHAEANQFTEESVAPQASITVQERPVTYYSPVVEDVATVEQVPQITEYVREEVAAVSTAEKFDRVEEKMETKSVQSEVIAPTYVAPATVSSVATAQYSLTAFAKIALASFVLLVVAFLSMIAVNSQEINSQRMQVRDLERQQQELREKLGDAQREVEAMEKEIEIAKSEETILAYAQEQGWVAGN